MHCVPYVHDSLRHCKLFPILMNSINIPAENSADVYHKKRCKLGKMTATLKYVLDVKLSIHPINGLHVEYDELKHLHVTQ